MLAAGGVRAGVAVKLPVKFEVDVPKKVAVAPAAQVTLPPKFIVVAFVLQLNVPLSV
ncbi:MAG TPA: hypothetical protein VNY36_01625 [Bacteroidia bacterium]|nr:hypothetical protein [Bacteroidia bacterium]